MVKCEYCGKTFEVAERKPKSSKFDRIFSSIDVLASYYW